MKKILFFLLLFAGIQVHAQNLAEEQAVKEVINQFFQALEQKDTVLFKRVSAIEGQVWALRQEGDSTAIRTRLFGDDVSKLNAMPAVTERAFSFDIHIHTGIAVAWVPYEFTVNGEFSHCGIDVFTLMKRDGTWQIVTAAYTVEKEDCDALDRKN